MKVNGARTGAKGRYFRIFWKPVRETGSCRMVGAPGPADRTRAAPACVPAGSTALPLPDRSPAQPAYRLFPINAEAIVELRRLATRHFAPIIS